ncbi:MAG: HEAT repeat domain-containing protein, partial [Gemmatimonadaceae bacterium]
MRPPSWQPHLVRHRACRRRAFVLALVATVVLPVSWSAVAAGQTRSSSRPEAPLQKLLAVEDSRTTNADSLRLLSGALRSKSAATRAGAARALGRFERAAFIPSLRPLIRDPDRQVRMEAINATAQIVKSEGRGLDSVLFDGALDALIAALRTERDPEVVGVIARSLGRIARDDSSGSIERVQKAFASLRAERGPMASIERIDVADPRVIFGVVHGMYSVARTRRPPAGGGQPAEAPGAIELHLVQYGIGGTPRAPRWNREYAARIRRLMVLTLTAANAGADSVAVLTLRDPDAQVRRLGVLAAQNISDADVRRQVLTKALNDTAFIVRFEGVRAWRRFMPGDCTPIVAATKDRNPHVMLAAVDALGLCANVDQARATLEPLASSAPLSSYRSAGAASWHTHAHALVALARIDAQRAAPIILDDVSHPIWQVRMYAARAAVLARDMITLARLANDSIGGVREAAINGLAATVGHVADGIFVNALSSDEHHVVLAAAKALKGTPARDSLPALLLASLERLTRQGNDNSRDPRMELLQRIGELGAPSLESSVEPYTRDYDAAVAERAAAIMSQWTGRAVVARPRQLHRVSPDLARIASSRAVLMRFTMSPASGGGSFVVRLRVGATAATSQRLIALAQRGYYNGLTFHRVEPTFVIQGGSPAATEYVGDATFMRDEVDLASHVRGTMGVSTRGRDTGDAQVFVNLTDNFRLDHDYTVAGEVIEGMSVV